MSLRRLRAGEWLALAGAVALVGLLFADWFQVPPSWLEGRMPPERVEYLMSLPRGPGTAVVIVAAVVLALAVGLCVAIAADVVVSRVLVLHGALLSVAVAALAVVALRVTVSRPTAFNGQSLEVLTPGWLALAAAALAAAGACWALHDERLSAHGDADPPPQPRPAPPPAT